MTEDLKKIDVPTLILLKLPLPPGCFPTLWNADERLVGAIFQNSRRLPTQVLLTPMGMLM